MIILIMIFETDKVRQQNFESLTLSKVIVQSSFGS